MVLTRSLSACPSASSTSFLRILACASAAGAALVYQTAWHSLINRGRLRTGEFVLIVGAGGGVNSASVQVAKFAGARVIVVGSTDKKLALAESLGADVLIDRSKEPDWSRAAFLATAKHGVDVVVDNVGTTFMSSLRALRKGGRLLTVGNTGGPKIEIDNRYMFGRHLSRDRFNDEYAAANLRPLWIW